MPNSQPFAIYETTAGNSGKLTSEGTHGVTGRASVAHGGVDDSNNSGMWFEVLKSGDDTEKYGSVPEFPSKNAGLDPKQSSR